MRVNYPSIDDPQWVAQYIYKKKKKKKYILVINDYHQIMT